MLWTTKDDRRGLKWLYRILEDKSQFCGNVQIECNLDTRRNE